MGLGQLEPFSNERVQRLNKSNLEAVIGYSCSTVCAPIVVESWQQVLMETMHANATKNYHFTGPKLCVTHIIMSLYHMHRLELQRTECIIHINS